MAYRMCTGLGGFPKAKALSGLLSSWCSLAQNWEKKPTKGLNRDSSPI
jgi:hypothetical protein